MPPKATKPPTKRPAGTTVTSSSKRLRGRGRGTATQLIEFSDTQISLPTRTAPRKDLAESQATWGALSSTFEERLRDAQDKDTNFVSEENSEAATAAITEAIDAEADSLLSSSFAADLKGIQWDPSAASRSIY
jgi:hypothetical protein